MRAQSNNGFEALFSEGAAFCGAAQSGAARGLPWLPAPFPAALEVVQEVLNLSMQERLQFLLPLPKKRVT